MGEHQMARRRGFSDPDSFYDSLERKNMAEKLTRIEALLPVIAAEIGPIAKARQNEQQGYTFRGIEDILNASHGVFMKHGVCVLPYVIDVKREVHQSNQGKALFYTVLTVEYTFVAGDGSERKARTVGEGMDSGDKSANKAMTAAFKNALIQVLMIPFASDDAEQDSHDVAAPEQGQQPPQGQPQQRPKPPAPKPQGQGDRVDVNTASIRMVPYYWDADAKQMLKMQVGSLNDEQIYDALDKATWTKQNKSGKYAKDAAADEAAIKLVMQARGLDLPQ